ncbi:hypothetical protein [Desulfoscipio geothermicus]|uniref:Sporulation membrane protein YtrI C-terminal domain-containing protein n=1 Tax=Desulfoscipio geothermicus DSM 3669 TaxID=1121426 RepID=A0A1I6D938_9FIRM|nr:hypothetical protein [Desulfoscipio geothermicus]SFR01985.1 hypothetical protein SAMN05660706_107100 [Desulfoscipio geothermicus DSM 3669]
MKRLLFGLAVFILGALTGAALTGISIGSQVDALYIENRALQDNLQVAEKELQQLRENSKTTHKRVISKITTRVAFSEECDYSEYERSTIELTVEKKVREWLKIISGQEVETINYQLVPRIVDNREMEVDGNKIQLKVNLVVIAENVVVYLEIIPIKDKV